MPDCAAVAANGGKVDPLKSCCLVPLTHSRSRSRFRNAGYARKNATRRRPNAAAAPVHTAEPFAVSMAPSQRLEPPGVRHDDEELSGVEAARVRP